MMLLFKIIAIVYLVYLGFKTLPPHASSIMRFDQNTQTQAACSFFLKGLALHASNPKAMLTWLAVLSLGGFGHANVAERLELLILCEIVGFVIFSFYALVFSAQYYRSLFSTYYTPIHYAFAACYFILAVVLVKI